MQDRTPTPGQEGRVLITPENGGTPFYATVTMADNPSVVGTPWAVETVLQQATAALFGLGSDAVPDDVLKILSRFHTGLGNEYVWSKNGYIEKLNSVGKTQLFQYSSGSPATVEYGLSVNISAEGTISIDDPITVKVGYVADGAIELSDFRALALGKYAVCSGVLYKFNDDATISGSGTSTRSVYVDTGGNTVSTALGLVGYVNSPNSDAYPPAEPDGYVYTPLGQLGNKVQIETGSYVGTGAYGSSNPNSLTFGFEPKLVFISGGGTQSPITMLISESIQPLGVLSSGSGESVSVLSYVSATIGKKTTWYSTGNENAQANKQGESYTYIALG